MHKRELSSRKVQIKIVDNEEDSKTSFQIEISTLDLIEKSSLAAQTNVKNLLLLLL